MLIQPLKGLALAVAMSMALAALAVAPAMAATLAGPTGLAAVSGADRAIALSWLASPADDGTFTYRVLRDGIGVGQWRSATTYVDHPALGRHVYQARAKDVQGHYSAVSASVTIWAVSSASAAPAPAQPAHLVGTMGAAGQASLTWQPGTGGNSPTAYYRVYRGGMAIASVESPSFDDFRAGRPAAGVEYAVQAVDGAGRSSALSDSVVANVNPRSYPWAGVRYFSSPAALPMVALTFDDCYHGAIVARLASILRSNHAAATFFCTGEGAAHNADVIANVARDFPVGNHSYDHPDLTTLSDSAVLAQLKKATRYIEAATGRPLPPIVRPPYGSSTANVRADCASLGLLVINWSVDTNDWRKTTTSQDVLAAALTATDGSIVLMHDRGKTADALPDIIAGLRSRGYRLVTIPEMFGVPWQPAEPDA